MVSDKIYTRFELWIHIIIHQYYSLFSLATEQIYDFGVVWVTMNVGGVLTLEW